MVIPTTLTHSRHVAVSIFHSPIADCFPLAPVHLIFSDLKCSDLRSSKFRSLRQDPACNDNHFVILSIWDIIRIQRITARIDLFLIIIFIPIRIFAVGIGSICTLNTIIETIPILISRCIQNDAAQGEARLGNAVHAK